MLKSSIRIKRQAFSSRSSLRTDIVHNSFGTVPSLRRFKGHYHDVWQIDYVFKGRIHVDFDKGHVEVVRSGELCLIPPCTWHAMHSDDSGAEMCSIKVSVDGLKADKVKRFKATDTIKSLVLNLGRALRSGEILMHSPFVKYILGAILEYAYLQTDLDAPNADSLFELVRKIIREHNGRLVSAMSIADRVGYSEGHLYALCRKKFGFPLKKLIDIERNMIAREHLLYSEKNISEISETMGFSDPFNFSKFIKRMNGVSPRQLRHTDHNTPFTVYQDYAKED